MYPSLSPSLPLSLSPSSISPPSFSLSPCSPTEHHSVMVLVPELTDSWRHWLLSEVALQTVSHSCSKSSQPIRMVGWNGQELPIREYSWSINYELDSDLLQGITRASCSIFTVLSERAVTQHYLSLTYSRHRRLHTTLTQRWTSWEAQMSEHTRQ